MTHRQEPIRIAPSLLSADFTRLGEELDRMEAAGADLLHLDVMDGCFVPNITFGPLIVEAVDRLTNLPLECHLMVENPAQYVVEFVEAGADYVTVHAEAGLHLHRTLQRINDAGAVPGIALNPDTSPESVQDVISHAGLLLIMTVNPGFGGQQFIEGMEDKLERAAALAPRDTLIAVDGGITPETAPRVVQAGASLLISGSYLFGAADPASALAALRRSAVGSDA